MKQDKDKIDLMVEKLYQILENEGISANEGWEISHHLKIKLEDAKKIMCDKSLVELKNKRD